MKIHINKNICMTTGNFFLGGALTLSTLVETDLNEEINFNYNHFFILFLVF